MRVFRRWLVSIAVIMFLSNAVSAQEASEEVSSDGSAVKAFSMFGGGGMVQAAGDFLKAVETLERFGGMLENFVSILSGSLVESSRNLAVMSDSFDPFGFKTAFKIIQEQGQTIQKLQKAEIQRLKKESRRMKKRQDRHDKKKRKRKSE